MQPDSLVSCQSHELPWIPWAMAGTHFKLLHADLASGRFSLLIKFAAGVAAPIHRHVGAVEGYMLEGGFHYHDQPELQFSAGAYLFEADGAVHRPVSPHGAVMFAVFHGPVEGLDDAGNTTGRIDCKWHIKTWDAALAARAAQSTGS